MKVKITKPNTLKGTISISGSKNTVLPLIACAALTKEEVILKNVPSITDVMNMIKIASYANAVVDYNPKTKELKLQFKKIKNKILCEETTKIRASYYFIGSILPRKKKLIINYPGGCNFSLRPIDYHIYAFKTLGYKIFENREKIYLKKKNIKSKKIIIKFPKQTVGATINTIIASVTSNKIVEIYNYASEPDVLSVIEMLNLMGANILVRDEKIKIFGVKKLHGVTYEVPFDRIEAGSYMILASSIPRSKVILQNIDSSQLTKIIEVLKNMNVKISCQKTNLIIESPDELKPINIKTGTYPDFPTDLQQILLILLLKAKGKSTIIDTIYPDRISQIKLLQENNINVYVENNLITIEETKQIFVKEGEALDLRGGFSLVVLAMLSSYLIIDKFEIVKRGYEDIENKLKKIQITIEKEN